MATEFNRSGRKARKITSGSISMSFTYVPPLRLAPPIRACQVPPPVTSPICSTWPASNGCQKVSVVAPIYFPLPCFTLTYAELRSVTDGAQPATFRAASRWSQFKGWSKRGSGTYEHTPTSEIAARLQYGPRGPRGGGSRMRQPGRGPRLGAPSPW